jgi:hypothetical protein
MENLKKLSIEEKNAIFIYSDLQKLTLLCSEILAAPILNVYRPKIYEMAEFITDKLRAQEEKKQAMFYNLEPCCKQPHFFCQCNAD